MVIWDYLVLLVYFLVMIGIGVYSSMQIKAQSDFFMGGRSFGKLLQTFAAFGAGTGSSDPVNTARTSFTSGMSGMWSVMYWLLVTPFYWITAVWYRRMRHLTLGDWFVERYHSRALGAGYCIFGLLFYMVYGSMLFSAIGKVAAPLIEVDTVSLGGTTYPIEMILVPIIGVVVLLYGIMGGLHAAYYTDLVQGLCIIFLSVVLIPYGLNAIVERFGDPETEGMMAGFGYLHEQLPDSHFHLVGSTSGSEFPLHRIVAVVLINLIGIVVQPHFIATGGGSAKNEQSARIGLVTGNFLKRFCTSDGC
jgi:solute:Na+ symporter, SSS family